MGIWFSGNLVGRWCGGGIGDGRQKRGEGRI